MSNCEYIQEKIPSFDELTGAVRTDVRQHISQCGECRKLLEHSQLIMATLARDHQESHIDPNRLTRYGIYLSTTDEPDYDGERLDDDEIANIESHLGKCKLCRGQVDRLEQEFQAIEAYLDEQGVPDLTLGPESVEERGDTRLSRRIGSVYEWIKELLVLPIPQLAPVALAGLAVLAFVVLVGPNLIQSNNPYLQLASLEGEKFTSLTRSATSASLADGLQAFHSERYEEAIIAFEQFIATSPEDENLFYVHYLTGASYLVEAKKTLLGRVRGFDERKIDAGIQHLQAAMSLTDNLGVQEDCLWYTAKAYLMIENRSKAEETLNRIINLRGRRFREAKDLIQEIAQASQSK